MSATGTELGTWEIVVRTAISVPDTHLFAPWERLSAIRRRIEIVENYLAVSLALTERMHPPAPDKAGQLWTGVSVVRLTYTNPLDTWIAATGAGVVGLRTFLSLGTFLRDFKARQREAIAEARQAEAAASWAEARARGVQFGVEEMAGLVRESRAWLATELAPAIEERLTERQVTESDRLERSARLLSSADQALTLMKMMELLIDMEELPPDQLRGELDS